MICVRAKADFNLDTSRPTELGTTELSSTGFVPLTQKALASNTNSRSKLAHSPSASSHISATTDVSQASSGDRPGISPVATPRSDSPPLRAAIGLPDRQKSHSGVSNVSDTERGHLRGISETSVSTDGAYATPMGIPEGRERGLGIQGESGSKVEREKVVSPLTPPIGVSESSGGDYLGVRPPGSSGSVKRKSQFSEKLDDDK
jgi:hypothetical protein